MDSEFWRWYVIFAALWGAATGLIGSKRGGSGFLWFLVGALIGPLALPLPFLLAGRPCPFCRKSISLRAVICPYCRSGVAYGTKHEVPPKPKPATIADAILIGIALVILMLVISKLGR